MYSGKMGLGHGFDEILTVASKLRDRQDILFAFIGHGSAYNYIEEYIKDNSLTNCVILPYQPIDMLPYSLGAADVSFITIKEQTDGLFLPSKIYDAMSSGSAIICISGGNNDVAHMVEQDSVGIQVQSGNAEKLKDAVVRFADDEEFLANCQKKARELAICQYSIDIVGKQYTTLFKEVTEKKG